MSASATSASVTPASIPSEAAASESVTRTLAQFCSSLRYEDLPPEVAQESKRLILDTIGCGLGGHEVEKGQMAVKLAQRSGGLAESTIVGVAGKFPSTMAAYANGELMNALDWNALGQPNHSPPYVVPASLALAEANGTTGKELITAVALGLETAARVGAALGGLRATPGGFPLRVWGVSSTAIGAAAGAGNILKFDTERMLHTIGLGGYYAPVPSHTKYNHTVAVGYAKYAPSGWVAQAGVTTALLAQMGSRGDTTVLDGEYGFWAMNGSPAVNNDKITKGLGKEWTFASTPFKYWPICGSFQAPLDVFAKIIEEHRLQPEEITDVLCKIEAFMGLPKYINPDPHDHVECASSLPYCIAVAAHRVKLGPAWQSRQTMNDPRIRAFMKKVRHGVDPRAEEFRDEDIIRDKLPTLRRRPALVEVQARGKTFTDQTEFARWLSIGEPKYRPSDDDLAKKFRANAEAVLSDAKAAQAVEMLLSLEKLDNVARLMPSLALD